MTFATSRGVRIHYAVEGGGPPLLLLHGLGASGDLNWRIPGWVDALRSSNRLILIDNRGHGESEKPHHAEAYSVELMAADALAVLDAEDVGQTAVMGYSMGSMVAMDLLLNTPSRFTSAILGGMGSRWPARGAENRCAGLPEAVRAASTPRPPGTGLRMLGSFLRHNDPIAQRLIRRTIFRGRPPVDSSRLGEIHVPVLVVAGSRDFFCEPSRELAAAIPGAHHEVLVERGHMGAVRDQRFVEVVKRFLAEQANAAAQASSPREAVGTS